MNFIIILLFFLSSVVAFSQPAKDYLSKEQRKKFYRNLSEKYSSAAIREVFNSDKKDDFNKFVDGKTELDMINSYSTVIHELLHQYYKSENGGYHCFVDSGIRIFVTFGKYYNSKELNSYVRKGQQDSIFRYPLYVGGNQIKLSPSGGGRVNKKDETEEEGFSIAYGIYGLVEEFAAYYFGELTMYQLYPYFLNKYGDSNPDAWKDYRHGIQSNVMAYYEFNLFIGWYLSYAKKKHPDIYTDMLNNKPLRVVYSLVEDKFRKLNDTTEKQMVSVNRKIGSDAMDVLDFSGSDEDVFRMLELTGLDPAMIYKEETTLVNGKSVMVKKLVMDEEDFAEMKAEYMGVVNQLKAGSGKNMDVFFAQPNRIIPYLKKQFTKEMLEELEKFRIKEVTTQNYRTYLK